MRVSNLYFEVRLATLQISQQALLLRFPAQPFSSQFGATDKIHLDEHPKPGVILPDFFICHTLWLNAKLLTNDLRNLLKWDTFVLDTM